MKEETAHQHRFLTNFVYRKGKTTLPGPIRTAISTQSLVDRRGMKA
jgi:hypothetical protein